MGDYVFLGNYEITKLRTTETVNVSSPNWATHLKELRSEGFSCLKKNLQQYLCTKMERPMEIPSDVHIAIRGGLANFKFSFPGPFAIPELYFDGSQTEWLYKEDFFLNGKKVSFFKFVQYQDGTPPTVTFPISQEQGIPYVDLLSEKSLGLHMILNAKNGPRTLGYIIEAKMESAGYFFSRK